MLSLDKLQSAFKQDNNQTSNQNNNYYPFWDMEIGQRCVIRFIADKDQTNPLGFLVEKLTHKIPVNGQTHSIPCLKMYEQECPICKVSSSFYKENDEDMGKLYWRKKQHIAQAIIVEDPFPLDPETKENHQGKLRYISLGYQLFEIIKNAIEAGELDDIPFDYDNGTDFIISKTQQGKYATYSIGSKFDRKPRPLTDEERAVAEEEAVELYTLLPKQPDLDFVERELDASLTGTSVDHVATSAATSTTTESPDSTTDNVATDASASLNDSDEEFDEQADAILARIRQRKTG